MPLTAVAAGTLLNGGVGRFLCDGVIGGQRAVAAQSCDERPARQSCRLQRRGRAARHRSSGAGPEAVPIPRRRRRLGVHGSAAGRRAGVPRAAGRAAVREARGQAARALEPERCGADRAEHLLRADSARFSARADRERVGRYAAHGPHRAAAAQRDGDRRRRQDRRAHRSSVRLRVRVPTGRARRRASAESAVPAAVRALERRPHLAGVPRHDDAHGPGEPARRRFRDAGRHRRLRGARGRRDRGCQRLLRERHQSRRRRPACQRRARPPRRRHDGAVRSPELEHDPRRAGATREPRRVSRRFRQHGLQHGTAPALRRAAQSGRLARRRAARVCGRERRARHARDRREPTRPTRPPEQPSR